MSNLAPSPVVTNACRCRSAAMTSTVGSGPMLSNTTGGTGPLKLVLSSDTVHAREQLMQSIQMRLIPSK